MVKLILAWMAYGALAALWYKYYFKPPVKVRLLAAVGAAASLVVMLVISRFTELLVGIQAIIAFVAAIIIVFAADRLVLRKMVKNGKDN